jgi:hypothetical protein
MATLKEKILVPIAEEVRAVCGCCRRLKTCDAYDLEGRTVFVCRECKECR